VERGETRERIAEAADELFYTNGYEKASFADIARSVGISRGNFYYHFKTKDEILDAVIELRVEKTRNMLARWEADGSSPAERIKSFVNILIMNEVKIQEYGCPVGTLCSELAKISHSSLPKANRIFTLFIEWLSGQYKLMGYLNDADELAMQIVGRIQGVAVMANSFQDKAYVRREVERMFADVDTLAENK